MNARNSIKMRTHTIITFEILKILIFWASFASSSTTPSYKAGDLRFPVSGAIRSKLVGNISNEDLNARAVVTQTASAPGRTLDGHQLLPITHGISAGWITSSCAVIWSKTNASSVMNVVLRPASLANGTSNSEADLRASVAVNASRDFTGRIRVCNLLAGTVYIFSVWFTPTSVAMVRSSDGVPSSLLEQRLLLPPALLLHPTSSEPDEDENDDKCCVQSGSFRTAPHASHTAKTARFVFGADAAGHNTCRDVKEGFAIFGALVETYLASNNSVAEEATGIDLFVGLGDMIYADKACLSVGRYGNRQLPLRPKESADLLDFWAHWRYLYEDANWQRLLSQTGFYTTWDDHEVFNDVGPYDDAPKWGRYREGKHLMPVALQAMLDYNPIAELEETPNRLYTNVRWGQHVELVILDTRQYRDARSRPDSVQWPKTLLGIEQKTWLKHVLRESNATWKIIACSVPLALGTGGSAIALDSWSNDNRDVFNYDGNMTTDTGYEQELRELFEFMARDLVPASKRQNIVFVTADVHFAAALRYHPLPNITSDFFVHEFITGPMSAVVWTRPNGSVHYDETFNPQQLFMLSSDRCHEAAPKESINDNCDIKLTWEEAKAFFNVVVVEVDESGGKLKASWMNAKGQIVHELIVPKQ